jgi:Domain of unknown function (DUF6265)
MSRTFIRSAFRVVAATTAFACALGLAAATAPVHAQTPTPVEPAKAPAAPLDVSALAWLDGCWRGDVAKYEIREHWLPLRGGIMVGAGHTVLDGKSSDYQYLRLETRPAGVYYVSIGSDRKETSFKLADSTVDGPDTIFTFTNVAKEFPERILYRRGTDGWLYATVEGKVNGEDKKVIYPLRRVDCQSGAFVLK